MRNPANGDDASVVPLRARPWFVPCVLCGLAVVGMFVVGYRFDGHLAEAAAVRSAASSSSDERPEFAGAEIEARSESPPVDELAGDVAAGGPGDADRGGSGAGADGPALEPSRQIGGRGRIVTDGEGSTGRGGGEPGAGEGKLPAGGDRALTIDRDPGPNSSGADADGEAAAERSGDRAGAGRSAGSAGFDDGLNRVASAVPPEELAALVAAAAGGRGIGSLADDDRWVSPTSSGRPWSVLGAVDGLLTFRGNPTRTYHGRGPVPDSPEVLWSVELGCSLSSVAGEARQWCGTGWTGQPVIFPSPGSTDQWWLGVGGYNRSVNFFDPVTGATVLPRFVTGDIIKGTVTADPDGYPLIYTGSRDNFFRVVAIDGEEPRELWRLSSASEDPTLWNNDWDSSGLVIDDHLFVGGENSRFYVVRLRRGYDSAGAVTVDPTVVFSAAGWDGELLAALGDRQVSIENSVAVSGDTVYFTNSGGLVQGWDISGLADGRSPERVFRYWTGDDTDASLVIDGDGMVYVASEYERGNARSRELGQIFKLDPSRPDDPVVWSRSVERGLNSGVWATPALHESVLIVPTDDGRVLAFDRGSGRTVWSLELPGPLWSSPAVVDDVLVQGDCDGVLHGFDLRSIVVDAATGLRGPRHLWSVELGGCIESTPAVWDGRIFVGTRTGSLFAVG